MSSTEMKNQKISSLEYWILKPFRSGAGEEQPYVKQVVSLLQSLQTFPTNTEEYDQTLQKLESVYADNKMAYQHVDRAQIQKAIIKMKSTVVSRILATQLTPVATKITEAVVPVVKKTWNDTISPAANKTLRFLHKTFAKKRIEVKRISMTETEVDTTTPTIVPDKT